MDTVFHHRVTSFVLMGSFVVATMLLTNYVARTWSYKHSQDEGIVGKFATGYLYNS